MGEGAAAGAEDGEAPGGHERDTDRRGGQCQVPFGDAGFFGSTGALKLNQPVLGMALRPPLGVKVDAFGDTASQASHWSPISGDEQLVLNHRASGPPAGARVYGVEGVDVSQLGVLRFTLETGPCDSSRAFALFYDTNGDGAGDTSRQFPCGARGAVKSFDPLAAGIRVAPS